MSLLKNQIIKKKSRPESPQDGTSRGAVWSAVAYLPDSSLDAQSELGTVQEASFDDDFDSNVKFDLLPNDVNQEVASINANVFPHLT